MTYRLPSLRLAIALATVGVMLVAIAPQARGQDGAVEVCTGEVVSRAPQAPFSVDLAIDPALPAGLYQATLSVANESGSFNGFETAVADIAGTTVGPTDAPASRNDFPQTATEVVTLDGPLTSITVSDGMPNVRHMSSLSACVTLTPLTCETLALASDEETLVVDGNDPNATYPTNAALAWEPWQGTDPSVWDININHTFTTADWIWETFRVLLPTEGSIVEFAEPFDIPGIPLDGTIHLTVDNGYELAMNGTVIGTAQLSGDWRNSNLSQDFVDGGPTGDLWQNVETWDLTGTLVSGENVLEITGVNEYMTPDDEFNVAFGNIGNNPAGLIYEAEITYCAP